MKKTFTKHSRKALYRSPNNKILGGVCSGLGYYLKISPAWIRLFLILLFIPSSGNTLLIYLVCWMIIPKAQTETQKKEMKEDFEQEKTHLEDGETNQQKLPVQTILVVKILGITIFVATIMVTITLAISLFAIDLFSFVQSSWTEVFNFKFRSDAPTGEVSLLLFILLLMPTITLSLLSLKMITPQIKLGGKRTIYIIATIWIGAILGVIYVAFHHDFHTEYWNFQNQ